MDQHLHDDLGAAFGCVEHDGAAQIPSAAVTEILVATQHRFGQPNQRQRVGELSQQSPSNGLATSHQAQVLHGRLANRFALC